MITELGYEECFTVCGVVDRNGDASTLQNATIVLATNEIGYTLPFTKTELGDKVEIGDKFIKKTEIIPI
jgi:hypothetical protein